MIKKRFSNSALFFVFSIFLISFNSCSRIKADKEADRKEAVMRKNARDIYVYAHQVKEQRSKAYTDYLESFTLEEKICQLFIENLNGNKEFFPMEDLSAGKPLIPGGFLFFGFNLADSPENIIKFTDSINSFCCEYDCPQPFLAIDHEGGPVNRLKSINAPLDSCEKVAQNYSVEQASEIYNLQALQLKNLGFHMNLAPVAEVCTKDNKDFLDERSFGNENQVFEYGLACVDSYEKNNIATVVKHFPGNTNTDPHTGLPVIQLTKDQINETLIPFKKILETKPTAVLMSHAIVNSVDKNIPSCLSKIWVTDILRNEYGYDGIIFSDDIFMAALAKNGYDTKTAVIMAVNAGIDCIMISGRSIKFPVRVLMEEAGKNKEFQEKIQKSFERIINYKIASGMLEYQTLKDGSCKITTKRNSLSVNEQALYFEQAKNQNIEFYEKSGAGE